MKHSRRHLPVRLRPALAFCLAVCGCAGEPYVDSRREAGQREPVGASTPDTVAICTSPRKANPEDLQKLADSECAKTGRTAERADEVGWSCTLSAPTRIFYRCVSKPLKP